MSCSKALQGNIFQVYREQVESAGAWSSTSFIGAYKTTWDDIQREKLAMFGQGQHN